MICNYDLVYPVTNQNAPFLYENGVFCVPNIDKNYIRYIEAKRYNGTDYDYFLLLSDTDFDEKCMHCRVDDYKRLKVPLHNDLLEYCKNIMNNIGNIKFEYVESNADFDVWQIKG